MMNRIHNTRIDIRRLSPAEAEVWITVEPEVLTPGTALRGKVTGPQCQGVTTVEVAYPVRPLGRSAEASEQTINARVLIPEPNLWTDKTPFVYCVHLELWEHGQRADVADHAVGLKQVE